MGLLCYHNLLDASFQTSVRYSVQTTPKYAAVICFCRGHCLEPANQCSQVCAPTSVVTAPTATVVTAHTVYCTVPTLSLDHMISTCRSYRVGTAATRRADAFLCTAICIFWHKVGIQQQLCHGKPSVYLTMPSQNPAALPRRQPSELPAELPKAAPHTCRPDTLLSCT